MKSLLACGCSFCAGTGLKLEKQDPKLWMNQLAVRLDYELTNIAQSGMNNDWIFVETMLELSKNQYDAVVVAWSMVPRINVNLGLELYTTLSKLDGVTTPDINTNNNVIYTKKWQKQVGDELLRAYSYHWDFLKLVKYVNILESQHKNIYFVNTHSPWTDNFFTKQDVQLPSDLDQFTQDLLSVETRDDKEIIELYNMIHKQYNDAGSIKEHLWLNLYKSLYTNKLDDASSTDRHPGYLSNDYYTKMLYPILKEKLQ
tara:strand:+ start:110 stop:880 length:771 start_codon:yes stop_codon:yes gene_type:complete